jgi:hypothetical protein
MSLNEKAMKAKVIDIPSMIKQDVRTMIDDGSIVKKDGTIYLDKEFQKLKDKFIEYQSTYVYGSWPVEESMKFDRANEDFKKAFDEIENVNFNLYGGWEEYVPSWIIRFWPNLHDSFKFLIYLMAKACCTAYSEGHNDGFGRNN